MARAHWYASKSASSASTMPMAITYSNTSTRRPQCGSSRRPGSMRENASMNPAVQSSPATATSRSRGSAPSARSMISRALPSRAGASVATRCQAEVIPRERIISTRLAAATSHSAGHRPSGTTIAMAAPHTAPTATDSHVR
jgi:hypothetical protein